jgi:hypothetical protein
MGFKIASKSSIRFIAALLAVADFGKTFEQFIEVELKVFSVDDWKIKTKNGASDRDILRDSLLDAKGILDENDQPVPFDDALKEQLLNEPWVVGGLIQYQIGIQRGISTEQVKKVLLGN